MSTSKTIAEVIAESYPLTESEDGRTTVNSVNMLEHVCKSCCTRSMINSENSVYMFGDGSSLIITYNSNGKIEISFDNSDGEFEISSDSKYYALSYDERILANMRSERLGKSSTPYYWRF